LPNQWHFVAWPKIDGQVTAFFRWLAHTHAMRFRVAHRTVGYGLLYRGRFKSLPVQRDEHLLTIVRYVERNALGAGLVALAEQWRSSSLWVRMHGVDALRAILALWPVEHPADWTDRVNRALSAKELRGLTECIERGRPFGDGQWVRRMARALSLEHTLRPERRPAKAAQKESLVD
jgi:putative transposase